MATEIERKFLVSGDGWRTDDPAYLCQGYLNRDKHRTVRVRVGGTSAFLTIKGVTTGASRAEFEYEIPVDDGKQMLELCERPLIEKHRHIVDYADLTWEVDEFLGDNLGLVVAEVELESEQQTVVLPPWAATEVTEDRRYYNSNLCKRPFTTWPDDAEA